MVGQIKFLVLAISNQKLYISLNIFVEKSLVPKGGFVFEYSLI